MVLVVKQEEEGKGEEEEYASRKAMRWCEFDKTRRSQASTFPGAAYPETTTQRPTREAGLYLLAVSSASVTIGGSHTFL